MKALKAFGIMGAILLLVSGEFCWADGIDVASPDFPPEGGEYVSPDEYFEYSAAGLIMDDPRLIPFAGTTIRTPVGFDEIETFDAAFEGVELGLGIGPLQLTGPMQTLTIDRNLSTTGTFDTELISLSLTGSTPLGEIIIREDPSRASTGQTEIMDLGGGLYHIDSFFDVFTELSVDGGASWTPSDSSTRMRIVPEPSTLAFMGVAGTLALYIRRLKTC